MKSAARRVPGALLLVLLCAPLYLYRLGSPGLGDPDEGRNAEVPREMLAGGDLVTPRLNDTTYLDKPPAFFWAVVVSYGVFGVNEFSARLPSALAGLAGIALAFWFARRHFGAAAGWMAGAALAVTPLYLVFGRLVIFDMLLTLCISASAVAAFEAMEGDERHCRAWGALLFAAAGAGTLVKGPVALVLPLLLAVVWAMVRRRPGLLRRLGWGAGVLIYAAVVGPWLTLVELRNPGFLWYAIVGENLARMTSDRFDTARPIYFYAKVILPGLFPWVVYGVVAAARRLGNRSRRRAATASPALYTAVWAGLIVLFFSLVSSKRPSYVLPCAVPVAILAGRLLTAALAARRTADGGAAGDEASRDVAAGTMAVAACSAVLGVAAILGGPMGLLHGMSQGRHDAFLARSGLFWMTAAAALLAGGTIAYCARRVRPAAQFAVSLLAILAMLPMARAVAGHVESSRSSRPVSEFLAGRLRPGDKVICFEQYRPGLNFYLRRPIYQVFRQGRIFTSNYIGEHLESLRGRPSLRVIPRGDLRAALLDDVSRAFVLSPRKEYDELERLAGVPLRRIYEDGGGDLFVRAEGED